MVNWRQPWQPLPRDRSPPQDYAQTTPGDRSCCNRQVQVNPAILTLMNATSNRKILMWICDDNRHGNSWLRINRCYDKIVGKIAEYFSLNLIIGFDLALREKTSSKIFRYNDLSG